MAKVKLRKKRWKKKGSFSELHNTVVESALRASLPAHKFMCVVINDVCQSVSGPLKRENEDEKGTEVRKNIIGSSKKKKNS